MVERRRARPRLRSPAPRGRGDPGPLHAGRRTSAASPARDGPWCNSSSSRSRHAVDLQGRPDAVGAVVTSSRSRRNKRGPRRGHPGCCTSAGRAPSGPNSTNRLAPLQRTDRISEPDRLTHLLNPVLRIRPQPRLHRTPGHRRHHQPPTAQRNSAAPQPPGTPPASAPSTANGTHDCPQPRYLPTPPERPHSDPLDVTLDPGDTTDAGPFTAATSTTRPPFYLPPPTTRQATTT